MLGERDIKVTVRPGSYTAGEWVPGTPSTSTVRMAVQPLNGEELQMLAEGERTKRIYKCYSRTELNTVGIAGAAKSDLVAWNGRNYEVHGVEDWNEWGMMKHYKYLLIGVGDDE